MKSLSMGRTLLWVFAAVILVDPAMQTKPMVSSPSNSTTGKALKTSNKNESPLYDLPTKIEEDEFLHEVGLFMLDVMNQSVNPCENFYDFACGNWTKSSRVPEQFHHIDFMSAVRQKANALAINFLKQDINTAKTSSPDAESKAKLFFQSCLKNGKNLANGMKVLNEELNSIFSKAKSDRTNSWMTLNFLSPYNVFPLLPVTLKHNMKDDRYDISFELPQRALHSLVIEGVYEEFRKLVQKTEKEMYLLFEFERNLTTKVFIKRETERLNITNFLMKYKAEPINWHSLFQTVFNTSIQNDWFVSNDVANFTKLDKFLTGTKPEILKDYIKCVTFAKFFGIWRKTVANDLQREEICRIHTENYFTYALSPWFIETAYSDELREDTAKIADAIRKEYIDTIESSKWLDDDTKSHLISKLVTMDIIIGYEDEMRQRSVVNEWYSGITMTNNWFINVMNLEAHKARKFLNSVATSAVLVDMVPYSVNGYYSLQFNTVFSATCANQMPLYHISFPISLKYGSYGMLFAHEMTHAFDIYGYNISFDGYSIVPLSEKSKRQYREIYECLQSHYRKFSHKGVRMNAVATFAENIADNIGGQISYRTYKNSISPDEAALKPLPGVDFTNDELFFIKLAQTWCAGYDDANKMMTLKNEKYSIEKFRALGVLRNMPEFSKVFKCKLGTYMNPLRKCMFW